MPITQEVRDDGRILYVTISDPWTLQELEAMYKPEIKLRDSSEYIMHTLINVKDLHKIHPAFVSVARRTPTFSHPRHGHLAIVGAIAFVQALAETLTRITRASNLRFFSTDEQALKYLRGIIADELAKAPKQSSGEIPTAGPGSLA